MIKTKVIFYGKEAREQIRRGAQKVFDAVKVTLGAMGRNVIIGHKYGCQITKDGFTVAQNIFVDDDVEIIGANLMKDVAARTVEQVGDATTTSVVLAYNIFDKGMKLIDEGCNPMEVKNGIDKGIEKIIETLKSHSDLIGSDYEKTKQVATVSANGDDEVGKMVADAYAKITGDGFVEIEVSKTQDTILTLSDGMQFDRGYIAPHFVSDMGKMITQMTYPYILVVDDKLSNFAKQVMPIWNQVVGQQKPLLIICEDLEGDALMNLIENKARGHSVCAVKSPGFGIFGRGQLEDIATITGATLITKQSNLKLKDVQLNHLGRCENAVVTKDKTTLRSGNGNKEKIEERIIHLKTLIEGTDQEHEKKEYRMRLAKLSGGIAVISVGGTTEFEMKEKKDRFEDAVKATKCAIEEGIVAGGGTALINCIRSLKDIVAASKDEERGIGLIAEAIMTPLYQMLDNGGVRELYEAMVKENAASLENNNIGFNLRTNNFEDLVQTGIIDATKAVRISLENAGSIASMLLTSEALIAQELEMTQPQMQQR